MNTTLQSDFERQIALEEEMVGAGLLRYRDNLIKAKEGQQEATTQAGLRLLKVAIEPMSNAIRDFLKEVNSGKPGRRHTAAKYLELFDPDVVAFLTIKTLLNSITRKLILQNMAITVAGYLEDEARFRVYQKENAAHFRAVKDRVKVKSSYDYQRTVMMHAMKKLGLEWTPWSKVDKLHLGQKCIDLMIESTGLIEVDFVPRGKNDTAYHVIASPKTLEWLDEENSRCELLSPFYYPMVIPPKDWTTPFNGGYYSHEVKSLKLVKTYNQAYIEELKYVDMPQVYKAINTIQRTSWRVNRKVLEVVQTIWKEDLDLGDLPPRDDMEPRTCPLPPDLKPKDMDESQYRIFKDWKREASRIYDNNVTNRSKRLLVAKILHLAEKFKDEPEIYFPYQMDFRGRIYAVPLFLNPQGPDIAKSLLTFAYGKPIQDQTAADWLAIHGANVYGYDKVSMKERVQLIDQMRDDILAIADDPLSHTGWTQADKPWQFLAFCFDWAEYLRVGFGYVSSLPVVLDGSCNGLQHFSAMLRDAVGGEAVNLVPKEEPQDIYQRVADVVIQKLEALVKSKGDEADMAQKWLNFGIDRNVAKRPVMVLPYGGTRFSCRDYVEDYIHDQLKNGHPNLFESGNLNGFFDASKFLGDVIWDSIGEVVVAAQEAMDWLRQAASIAAKEELPINWTTPAGLPVQQSYRKVTARRVKTMLGGNIIKLSLTEDTDDIDVRKQANGISPNFVHSMDAAALMLYVCQANDEGIHNFALVHDSYGTLAADTEASARCLREAFVRMYETDVLEHFRDELLSMLSDKNAESLPPIPDKGKLDLESVKESYYFFA